jgi:hypothetical protein
MKNKTNTIAPFMGAKGGTNDVFSNVPVPFDKKTTMHTSQMKYDRSWDWIIPVCKKLHAINVDIDLADMWSEKLEDVQGAIRFLDIKKLFNKVAETIHWYNCQAKDYK